MAINITEIFPSSPYSSQDEALIQSSQIEATFDPSLDYIEYVISTPNNSFQSVDTNYNRFSFPTNGTVTSNQINSIEINPSSDISAKGFNSGEYNVYYNFYRNELLTSPTNKDLFIKSISADKTELVVRYVSLSTDPASAIDNFISSNTSFYFNDFYLNFGNNILLVANNIQVNPTTGDILINLYSPLPSNLNINSNFWVVTKIANSLAFNISFTQEVTPPPIITFDLKGPNLNINTKDQVNNTTDYINYSSLLTNPLTSSVNQIKSILDEKGIEISIDYTDFTNFVHFSSAEQRLNNFYYKVKQIEDYNTQIATLSAAPAASISSSVTVLQNNITSIIQNFDGYEYYLYYESSSYAWPKSNNTVPYTLYSTSSVQVQTWFGSTNPSSIYYGGITQDAFTYDDNNQDYLFWSIPEYLRDDTRNAPYYSFVELVGQHYDYIWTYYKDVSNRYNADNRLDFGISKDLVAEALKSFGVKIYQNNFTTGDLFNAFTGFNTGSTGINLTPTGSDLITNYVTASYEASITPIDDLNKEIYKRIYHNLPYLAKTKGTIPGLRALINCFGVPDTVLRISEFGGRDKDTSTYDYFDQQFNYALNSNESRNPITSSFILNSNWGAENNIPESIQLRIKPYIPSDFSIQVTQSLIEISGSVDGYTTNLTLWYTGSGLTTSSYSGSDVNPYYQYGTLYLDIKGNLASQYTCSIYAPFFDGNWWSIMINRSGSFGNDPSSGAHTFTLLAGSTGYYDGYDGNQIMSLYSSSTSNNTPTWGYSGSKISFFDIPTSPGYPGADYFYGNSQEIRYWAATQSIDSFKDYIMNPQSIDYIGETSYANTLVARLPLGGDLYTGSISVHPKVTGSWATTSSFISNSDFYIFNTSSFNTNVEARFLNSPIIGLRGRVTDKIQIVSSSLPTGSVLSQYTSIEQSYPSLGSESPDVNMLEVAFSPQNEVNDDIINSLGYFNIGEYIGDPRQVSSSATSYPDLNVLSNNFFQKYFDTYDLTDYVRLIKYFDNSLFKMIKDFVPARTSLTTGVVIKQHILERNKYPQPQAEWEELDYSGSIQTAFFSGSTGGTFNQYNVLTTTQTSSFIVSGSFIVDPEEYINYFNVSSSTITNNTNSQVNWGNGEITTNFNGLIILIASGSNSPGGNTIDLRFSSSLQGTISTTSTGATTFNITSSLISCSYGEKFSLYIQDGGSGPNIVNIQFGLYNVFPYSQQTWLQYYTGSTGVSTIVHSTQDEFYNGELPGTEYVVTNGELNPDNEFKYPSTTQNTYTPTLYVSNITSLEDFLNINTSPNQGEIYLWFDTGSFLNINPPGVPTAFTPG